jgi:hypothetical protein
MLAHNQGELLDQSKLASPLAINGQPVGRYIDLLCDLMLVRRLPAWSGNVGKRLIRSPKVSVRDSGLVHALLGLNSLDAVLSHPVAGSSWEGFVVEQLINAAPTAQASFYRTSNGAELTWSWSFAAVRPGSLRSNDLQLRLFPKAFTRHRSTLALCASCLLRQSNSLIP